ncbi:unnamed protein product, partial [Adineta steineri]
MPSADNHEQDYQHRSLRNYHWVDQAPLLLYQSVLTQLANERVGPIQSNPVSFVECMSSVVVDLRHHHWL